MGHGTADLLPSGGGALHHPRSRTSPHFSAWGGGPTRSPSVSVTHVLHCTEGLLTLLQACFKNLSLAMRHPTNLAKNLSLGSEPVRS